MRGAADMCGAADVCGAGSTFGFLRAKMSQAPMTLRITATGIPTPSPAFAPALKPPLEDACVGEAIVLVVACIALAAFVVLVAALVEEEAWVELVEVVEALELRPPFVRLK